MDLVYADQNKKDIGVLSAYNMDMAYGTDENNFECVIDRNDHCCQEGYFLYVENEEYGGIVDSIKVNTGKDEIFYIGRTWHGILESKVICPDDGQDYAIFDGDANSVLAQIIENLCVDNLFCADSEPSGIDISAYQMDRYITGYTGIKKMLKTFDAKLKIKWINGKVNLSAVLRHDYSQDEEFDTSQVDFILQRNFKPVNHIICLGQGDLRDRAVIHLFTDENGGVLPYSFVDEPLQDSDYILDMSSRLLKQENEIVETLDYSNAEITENYIKLEAKPMDWNNNCESYYEQTDDGFDNVKREDATIYTLQKIQPYDWSVAYDKYFIKNGDSYDNVSSTTSYILQTSRPSDWSSKYENYFIKSGSGYKEVESKITESYIRQNKKPVDWSKSYKNYFVFYSDGVNSEYRSVDGVTKYKYSMQTRKPSDWADNYKNYYKKAKNGGYTQISTQKAPVWKAKTYYTKYSYQVAPPWSKESRYTYQKKVSAPAWKSNTYYTKDVSAAPAWTKNKFYTQSDEKVVPKWTGNKYYKVVYDRYAVMVAKAIERFEEAHAADALSIDLAETEQCYDIGDLVGSTESVTGFESVQEVVKKIIKISNNDITVNYEVK